MPEIPAGVQTKSMTTLAQRLSGAWQVLTGSTPASAPQQAAQPPSAPAINATTSRDFGPLTPLPARYGPGSAEATGPRQFVYPVGSNIIVEPRTEVPGLSPFWQLRNLAALYDVASVCVATRIEQVQGMGWSVQAKDKRRQASYQDACNVITDFFRRPDGLNPFETWIGMLIREHLVTDAVTIFPQLSETDDLLALELVDGATIKPLIDDRGRVRAYQQILYGYPASNYARQGVEAETLGRDGLEFPVYTTSELLYLPRFVSVASPYGSPPTEWIILRINQALRKQTWDISYFTEGNIPDMLATMPEGAMTPEQIEEFERNFNALLQGNDSLRRMIRFMPYQAQVQELRPYSYETTLDDWMLRVTCAAYAVPPQEIGFTNDVNRATAELQEAVNERRGLKPLVTWMKRAILDETIQAYFARPASDSTTVSLPNTPTRPPTDPFREIEWVWSFGDKADKTTEAQMYQSYIDAQVLSPDEVRAMVWAGAVEGPAPLSAEQREAARPTQAAAAAPPPAEGGALGGPEAEAEAPPAAEEAGAAIETAARAVLRKSNIWRDLSSTDRRMYEYRLAQKLRTLFDSWSFTLAAQTVNKGLEPLSFYHNVNAEVGVVVRRFVQEVEDERRSRYKFVKRSSAEQAHSRLRGLSGVGPAVWRKRFVDAAQFAIAELPSDLVVDLRARCGSLLPLGWVLAERAEIAATELRREWVNKLRKSADFNLAHHAHSLIESIVVATAVEVANGGWTVIRKATPGTGWTLPGLRPEPDRGGAGSVRAPGRVDAKKPAPEARPQGRGGSAESEAYGKTVIIPPLHPNCRCKLRARKVGEAWLAVWWSNFADPCKRKHKVPWGQVNGCEDLKNRCVTSGPRLGQNVA